MHILITFNTFKIIIISFLIGIYFVTSFPPLSLPLFLPPSTLFPLTPSLSNSSLHRSLFPPSFPRSPYHYETLSPTPFLSTFHLLASYPMPHPHPLSISLISLLSPASLPSLCHPPSLFDLHPLYPSSHLPISPSLDSLPLPNTT